MKDDISSPAPAPAKTAKPRAKAKSPEATLPKTAKVAKVPTKPKAPAITPKETKASIVVGNTQTESAQWDLMPTVPVDAVQVEARKLDQARAEGVMDHLRREALHEALAAKNQALWEKNHPEEKDVEPMSDAQRFEFFRLQRQQDQEKADAVKAAEVARLATVSPKTVEQSFAAARTEQADRKSGIKWTDIEPENSIEAGPVREVTTEMAHDRKSLEVIRSNMQHNIIAPQGDVSREEAAQSVTEDVAAVRGIKDKEIRDRALLFIEESKFAQVQYRIALDKQAPDVAKEASAASEAERSAGIQQSIDAKAKTLNARWSSMGKQGMASTLGQGAANFAARGAQAPTFSDLAAADRAAEDRTKAIPDAVKAKYLKVENDYFFQDKKPAFIDRGTKLATKGENPEVIASLVAIAQARGWGNVTVKGTEDFRRAAWHEASLNGLEVAGYKPSKVEEAHLAAAKAAVEKAKPENTLEKGRAAELAKAPETPVQAASAKTPATMRDTVKEAPAAPSVAAKAPAVAFPDGTVGKLIEHGKAPYQNNPDNDQSYFVTVETGRGNKTMWGKDLARAMQKSGAKVGETISLEGTTVEGSKLKSWTVGSMDKASAFMSGKREEVVKEHPDLSGAYGTVAAAQAFAMQHFPGHEERFAAVGKAIIAADIAAGKDVPAVQIREVQKVKAVDQSRTKTDDRERA